MNFGAVSSYARKDDQTTGYSMVEGEEVAGPVIWGEGDGDWRCLN